MSDEIRRAIAAVNDELTRVGDNAAAKRYRRALNGTLGALMVADEVGDGLVSPPSVDASLEVDSHVG